MSRLARAVAACCGLALGLGCRSGEPVPAPPERSAEQEARELVAQARREVESEPPPVSPTQPGPALHVPEGEGRLPLIVFLHGLGGSGGELVRALHLDEMAQAFGFAFLAPDGVLDSSGRRFWNASDSCCNFENRPIDHVAELRRWIGEATGNARVDARRVYIVGFSNGGFMAYRAACEIGSLLTGIVSIAGAGPGEGYSCKPERKLSVVQIHGDRDPIVKFAGGFLFADTRRPRHPSAEQSLASWAKLDGCSAKPEPGRTLDLDPRVPGAETSVSAYSGCSGRHVELWRIAGGDHTAGLSRFSIKAITDFIAADPPADPAAP